MIVITGAAGFIASALTSILNAKGYHDLVLVDDFSKPNKQGNLNGKSFLQQIHRDSFLDWLKKNYISIDFIIHLGARTDTTEFDYNVFQKLNVDYTLQIWNLCCEHQIPLIYASSAATYGDGELGYIDSHEMPFSLKPLNPYGRSKNEIDKTILNQVKEDKQPPFWAGLKFFNVYGPNEYHKGRMASVILHSFHQIQDCGYVKLFRSHRKDYVDGQQLRDFIYVKDIAKVIIWLMENRPESGLYNVGTGKARSFYDLAASTFKAMEKEIDIRFIDIPADIRDKYQYFTEADMSKLRHAGYNEPFHSLEEGVTDYVRNYLIGNKFL